MVNQAASWSAYGIAVTQGILILALAWYVRRYSALRRFPGTPGYLTSLGITLFLVTFSWLAGYVTFGWGNAYTVYTWMVLLAPVVIFVQRWRAGLSWNEDQTNIPRSSWLFYIFAGFVMLRFWNGLPIDQRGNAWCNFNFLDTPFHMSVANAFLHSPQFPPVDLDMSPFPLKYHFLADFLVAHMARLGLPTFRVVWFLNLLHGLVLTGAVWSFFSSSLKLSRRWVLLGCFVFLFLNTSVLNWIHYQILRPPFFRPSEPLYGIFLFPFFNFESMMMNLIEPQRGLLFSLPLVLVILSGCLGFPEPKNDREVEAERNRVVQLFWLVCLLPLAHIVSFAVAGACLIPLLWKHRVWFLSKYLRWLPACGMGCLQLYYLFWYGPPANESFSEWDAWHVIPFEHFHLFPKISRPIAFWVFVDGDFLVWGTVFTVWGLLRLSHAKRVGLAGSALGATIYRWRWFLAIAGAALVMINFFRYSSSWGDSNKFVFFLNLGLAVIMIHGGAELRRVGRARAAAMFWMFLFLLCVLPASFEFYYDIIKAPHPKIILFRPAEEQAASWIKQHSSREDVVLTGAYDIIHFVTPLAGARTLAGIYSDSNLYHQVERGVDIRLVYERADFAALRRLAPKYVCISSAERSRYKLSSKWEELAAAGQGVLFQAGGTFGIHDSVYLFSTEALLAASEKSSS